MLIQGLVAGATIAIAVAIYYHRQAVLLQRDSIQAAMFSDIAGRISSILKDIPPEDEDEMVTQNWYVRLFNELEAFIFLTRLGYLSPRVDTYYRELILGYMDKVYEESPQIAKHLTKDYLPPTFEHLREYYRIWRMKPSPW